MRTVTVHSAESVAVTGTFASQDLKGKVNKRAKVLAMGVRANALGTINSLRR